MGAPAKQSAGEISAHEYEYRERHKDGYWIWILSRGNVIERAADGRPLRVLGTDTDITHLKDVETELAQEKERFRVALESIGDGVISTDACGLVTFMNPIAEHLTGWLAADALGKPVTQVFALVAEDTGDPALNPVAECLERECLFRRETDVLLVSRTGERRDIRDSTAPLKWNDAVTGAVLVFHDVTSSRALQPKPFGLVAAATISPPASAVTNSP